MVAERIEGPNVSGIIIMLCPSSEGELQFKMIATFGNYKPCLVLTHPNYYVAVLARFFTNKPQTCTKICVFSERTFRGDTAYLTRIPGMYVKWQLNGGVRVQVLTKGAA